MRSNLVCVGIITKPVGICGHVKIVPYTVTPHSFLQFKLFFIYDDIKLTLEFPRINNKSEITTRLKNYNTRNDVELLRLKHLYIKRNYLPPLLENEYYLEDLRGLNVLNENRKNIGVVNTVLDYGAGAFLDIKLFENRRVVTIPFDSKSILDVNLESRQITVIDYLILY